MAHDNGSGFNFCGIAIVVGGGSLSDRPPAVNNHGGGRTGPPREVVEINSDEEGEEEEDGSAVVARKLRFDVGKKSKSCVAKEDDDCVVLDSDPDGAVAVGEQKGSAGFDVSLDELQIVAEKGQVACRDFPHSRHLCSKLPFISTSHVKHCSMCYCFVCDAPAPCKYWGKGLSTDDHCHSTDKETRWKILRQAFKCERLPASHSEEHQNVVYLEMAPHRQQDIQRDILQGVLPNAGQTVGDGAPRASPLTRDGRGRDTAHIAPATRPHSPCRQEPYEQEEDEEYTSEEGEEYTSEEDKEYTSDDEDEYLSVKAKVYVGNLHCDIVSEDLDVLFGEACFVEYSEVMYNQQTWQSCGSGIVTMSSVKEVELAVKMFDGYKLYGRRLTVHKAAPRVAHRQSKSSFRIYAGNLLPQAGDSWLKGLFSEHGKVVEARVVKEHSGWTFGFVKMATEDESYDAIDALNKQNGGAYLASGGRKGAASARVLLKIYVGLELGTKLVMLKKCEIN